MSPLSTPHRSQQDLSTAAGRRATRRLSVAPLALAAALALSACGGGGDSADTPAAAERAQAQAVLADNGSAVSFANSAGLSIPARLWRPAQGGAVATVVMLHGCSGVYSYSDPQKGIATLYREWAARLTQAGYAALLVDSFTPRGTQNECGNGNSGVDEVHDRPKDAIAAAAWLAASGNAPAGRIALLGWSNGGSALLSAMDSSQRPAGGPGAFVSAYAFYPGCGLWNEYGGISGSTWLPYAPVTLHHGSLDPLYTSGHCDTRLQRAQLLGADAAHGNAVSMTVHSGARHSFDGATQVNANFSADDVAAKTAADSAVMSDLALRLQP